MANNSVSHLPLSWGGLPYGIQPMDKCMQPQPQDMELRRKSSDPINWLSSSSSEISPLNLEFRSARRYSIAMGRKPSDQINMFSSSSNELPLLPLPHRSSTASDEFGIWINYDRESPRRPALASPHRPMPTSPRRRASVSPWQPATISSYQQAMTSPPQRYRLPSPQLRPASMTEEAEQNDAAGTLASMASRRCPTAAAVVTNLPVITTCDVLRSETQFVNRTILPLPPAYINPDALQVSSQQRGGYFAEMSSNNIRKRARSSSHGSGYSFQYRSRGLRVNTDVADHRRITRTLDTDESLSRRPRLSLCPPADQEQSLDEESVASSTTANPAPRIDTDAWKCWADSSCGDLENPRKVISNFFGRNKSETKRIPLKSWLKVCRKHYQRRRYRGGKASSYIEYQTRMLHDQLDEFEKHMGTIQWTIQYQSSLTKLLDTYINTVEKSTGDPKPSPPTPEVDGAYNLRSLCGMNKSTREVHEFIDLMHSFCKEKCGDTLLKVEFLPKRWGNY